MERSNNWTFLTLCLFIYVAVSRISRADFYSQDFRIEYDQPVNKCMADGQLVCASCDVLAICVSADAGGFELEVEEQCEEGEYCSEDYEKPGPGCYRLAPQLSPVCSCSTNKTCEIDPYDPKDYILCGDDDSIEYGSCGKTEFFDLDLCLCEDACFSCGYYFPGPENDCKSYYECGSGNWSVHSCDTDFCFNPDTCECEFGCPPCGYAPYPDNSTMYIYCANGNYIVHSCVDGTKFDPEECWCIHDEGSVTQTTTPKPETTTEYDQCDKCGFYEYPGSCSTYYKCYSDDTLTIESCPGNLCFNPDYCYCENNCDFCGVTESPNITDPCLQCGFYPYEGSCTKFYECHVDGSLEVQECPNGFCFIPENCFCTTDCSCSAEDGFLYP